MTFLRYAAAILAGLVLAAACTLAGAYVTACILAAHPDRELVARALRLLLPITAVILAVAITPPPHPEGRHDGTTPHPR